MQAAADRAEAVGRVELADAIGQDASSYEEGSIERVTASSVYSDIEEIVQDAEEVPSFAQVQSIIHSRFPIPSMAAIGTLQFKRARKVYDKAVAERLEYDEMANKRKARG